MNTPARRRTACARTSRRSRRRAPVNGNVRDGLRAVSEHRDAALVRFLDRLDGVDRASEFETWFSATILVRSVKPVEQIHPQLALVGDGQHLQRRALLSHSICQGRCSVVLHLGNEYLVALADVGAAVGGRTG